MIATAAKDHFKALKAVYGPLCKRTSERADLLLQAPFRNDESPIPPAKLMPAVPRYFSFPNSISPNPDYIDLALLFALLLSPEEGEKEYERILEEKIKTIQKVCANMTEHEARKRGSSSAKEIMKWDIRHVKRDYAQMWQKYVSNREGLIRWLQDAGIGEQMLQKIVTDQTTREKFLFHQSSVPTAIQFWGRLPSFPHMKEHLQHTHSFVSGAILTPPEKSLFANTPLRIQIGEYGETLARNIYRATQELLVTCCDDPEIVSACLDVTKSYQVELEKTARGDSGDYTAIRALHEGILTIGETMGILTAKHVEGYEDPDILVAAIIDANILEQLARVNTGGILGPMARELCYVDDLVFSQDGKVQLCNFCVDEMDRFRQKILMRQPRSKLEVVEFLPTQGLGCPVAFTDGVKMMAETWLQYFQHSREDNKKEIN